MNRRQLLRMLAAGSLAPALLRAKLVLADAGTDSIVAPGFFSPDQRLLVSALADTIIPATKTPSASSVGVQDFVELMVGKSFMKPDQADFMSGLAALDRYSENQFGTSYTNLSEPDKNALLRTVADGQVDDSASSSHSVSLQEFFHVLKQLIVIGYYTSETGASKELRYRVVPGHYEGCTDMTSDQVAWSYGSRSDGLF